jgi:hypothetical protein
LAADPEEEPVALVAGSEGLCVRALARHSRYAYFRQTADAAQSGGRTSIR